MSKDEYSYIFLPKMETIVFIILQIVFARTGSPGRNKPIKTLTETSGLVASRDGK